MTEFGSKVFLLGRSPRSVVRLGRLCKCAVAEYGHGGMKYGGGGEHGGPSTVSARRGRVCAFRGGGDQRD